MPPPLLLAVVLGCAALLAGCNSGNTASSDSKAAQAGLKAQESAMQDQMMRGP